MATVGFGNSSDIAIDEIALNLDAIDCNSEHVIAYGNLYLTIIFNNLMLFITRIASRLARSDTPSITCILARLSCSDTPT